MSSINSEENQTSPSVSGETEINDLEDTRPRRVSSQPAGQTLAASEPAAEDKPALTVVGALAEAQPADASLEDTNPIKVRPPAEALPIEEARASLTGPQAVAASSETIPPPPSLGEPATAAPVLETGAEAGAEAGTAVQAEPVLEDTNPVKVRRAQESVITPAEPEEIADAFTSPEARAAFDETIPPPPGLDQPVLPVAPLEAAADRLPAPSRPQPARKPAGKAAGKPNGKPAGRPAGKVVRKKATAGAAPGARLPGLQKLSGLSWIVYPLLGLGILVLIAGLSALFGYLNGINLRIDAAKTQSALSASEQYQLGLQEMAEGKFYNARQRFEYVIQLDPNYPGATDKLAEALMYLNATATPTVQPTPTITPTPDTRAVEELYSQAQQAMQNSDWNAAVTALLALRAKDVNYHVVDVDGLLFLALRNRGRDKITKTDLEGGIYDLTLAGNFAPLDTEAQALLTWSQMYITGASFWDLDWAQVVDYFSQVAPQMPNLMDSSGMTATERYWRGLFEYGNTFASRGQACKALDLYQQSLNAGGSGEVQQAMQNAAQACGGGSAESTETPKPGKKNKTPTP